MKPSMLLPGLVLMLLAAGCSGSDKGEPAGDDGGTDDGPLVTRRLSLQDFEPTLEIFYVNIATLQVSPSALRVE